MSAVKWGARLADYWAEYSADSSVAMKEYWKVVWWGVETAVLLESLMENCSAGKTADQ